MRWKAVVGVFAAAGLWPAAAAAQWEAASAEPEAAPTAAETDLSFSSEDTGLEIRMLAGPRAGRGEADTVPRACRTPCRLRVPNGAYRFTAGDHEFDLVASGGAQQWLVEDDDWSLFAVGVIGIVLGAASTAVGGWGLGSVLSDENPDQDWLIGAAVATGVGGAVAIGSIVMVSLSFGSAELLSEIRRTEAADLNGRGWGLRLSLRM